MAKRERGKNGTTVWYIDTSLCNVLKSLLLNRACDYSPATPPRTQSENPFWLESSELTSSNYCLLNIKN